MSSQITFIDRFNMGELRRYRHTSGAVLVIHGPTKRASIIPAWCPYISRQITRAQALCLLNEWRKADANIL